MPKRILLVDDDIAGISALKRILMRAGHQTLLATNSSDAQAAVAQQPPDLLIVASACDSGQAVSFAQRFAETERSPPIPVIVLGESAEAPVGVAVLPLPIDPAQLNEELQRLLGDKGAGAAQAADRPVPLARLTAPSILPADDDRRAAANALRARAAELRTMTPLPAGGLGDSSDDLPPAAAKGEVAKQIRLAAVKAKAKAEQERARETEARAHAEALAQRFRREREKALAETATERSRRAEEEEERARAEEEAEQARLIAGQARAEIQAERARRAREEEERVRAEEDAEQARLAAEQARAEVEEERARRAREEEERARAEEDAEQARLAAKQARAEVEEERARRAQEEEEHGQSEAEAEERASAEAEARRRVEDELSLTTVELEAERVRHEAELADVRARTIAEERAAEELRRLDEEEMREIAARREESYSLHRKEEELRRAAEEAELARRESAEQKRRADEEARRRAETEKKLARLAEETRLAENERKRAEEARRRAEIEAELERIAAEEQAEKQREDELAELAIAREEAERTTRQASVEQAIQRAEADETVIRMANEEAARGRALSRAAERRTPQKEGPSISTPPHFSPVPESAGPPADEATSPDLSGPQPDVSAVPPALAAGSIAETPFPRLLTLSVRAEITGRLDFVGELSRSLYFEEGRLVGATSTAPHERAEEMALRLGLITRDQFRQAAPIASGLSSRRVAILLLDRGFLKPTELTPLVRTHTEEVLFAIFAETDAHYRYSPVAVPADERVTLERGTLALAVEGIRRRWLAPMLDRVLGGAGTLLVPAQDAPSLSELGLTPAEQRLATSVDGLRTLDEIMAGSSVDPLSARQCLTALVMVGVLSIKIYAPSGTPQTTARIDIARVREKLEQVRRADYFAILGLSRVSSPHEIREAETRLRVEFDPQRFAGCPEIGLDEKLAEILRVVTEAGEVLGDDQLRAEYLQGIGN